MKWKNRGLMLLLTNAAASVGASSALIFGWFIKRTRLLSILLFFLGSCSVGLALAQNTNIFPANDTFGNVLSLAMLVSCRFSVEVIIAILFLYAAEVWPVRVRPTGNGIVLGVGRLMAIISPFLQESLESISSRGVLYFFIAAGLCYFAFSFSVCLPLETRGRDLHDNVEVVPTSLPVLGGKVWKLKDITIRTRVSLDQPLNNI